MQKGRSLKRRWKSLGFSIRSRIFHRIHPSFISLSEYVYRDVPLEIKRINMQLKNLQDKCRQLKPINRFISDV